MAHRPVLLDEMLVALRPRDGGVYVDATFGGGGYARAMLAAARCRVIGLDRDPDAVTRARALEREESRFTAVEAAFGRLEAELHARNALPIDGIVFDLGVSSFQLDEPGRGFSFQADGPLDMRMARTGPTAADLIASLDERALARLLGELGDEPQARAVARAIVRARAGAAITTTRALAAIVARAKGGGRGPRDPATQTFQALRIAVNDELGELERGLAAAEASLRPGGRLVVVAFHSGGARTVKRFVNTAGGRQPQPSRHVPPVEPPRPRWRWVSSGVIKPRADEVAANPRARSARLRVAERLDDRVDEAGEGPWPLAA